MNWGFGLLAVLGLCLMQDSARAEDFSGLYFGGNFGRAHNEYNTGIADGALVQAATAVSDDVFISDRSTRRLAHVWWADVGYYLTPNLGVEAEYLHLGGVQYLSSGTLTVGGVDQPLSTGQEVTSRGPAISLIGRFPVTQWFELHAQVGDYAGKAVLNQELVTGTFQSGSTTSKTGSSLLAGGGLAFNFGGHWSVRLDYLRANKTGGGQIGKFSVDMATGGISFTF